MRFRKNSLMLILILTLFLLGIASVSASEIDNTITSDDTNMELSADDDTIADNLQTNDENSELTLTDTDVLGEDSAKYSDLAEEVSQSGNVKLKHKNYTYDAGATAITITEDNKVIDGDGAVIDMKGSAIRAFNVTASGVTIKNLSIKNANFNGEGGAIYFKDTGTVSNCNFTNNAGKYMGGAVYLNSGSVTNCNFTNNKATGDYSYGGAIYMSSGNVENCNFTNNKATGDYDCGGAIYFSQSGTVTNCNFTDNAAKNGGAIYCYYDGYGTMTNCTFTNNKATGDHGGAVWIYSGTVTDCNFADNSAAYGGGAIYGYRGSVSNCNFTDNSAYNGGAIYGYRGSVSDCNFADNDASYGGGAIYLNSGNVTNSNFVNNSASRYGGAVDFSGGAVTNCSFTDNSASNGSAVCFHADGTVRNCNFTKNTASQRGGAVYFTFRGAMSDCNFADNSAAYDGGALWMSSGTVSDCSFTNNSAGFNGGAILTYTGNVTNCNFTKNTASRDGGAVYFSDTGNVTNCNFINNSAIGKDSWGGAIRMYYGTVSKCSFTNNKATGDNSLGGAIFCDVDGEVTNCSFTKNTASRDGGAVYFSEIGNVSNCNFTGNNATNGSAIYFHSTSATKTVSNSCFLNNRANAEALKVTKNDNNITITFTGNDNLLNAIYSRNDAEVTFTNVTYWGANGIATVSATMSGSNNEAGQNITVVVVVNGELVLNEVKVTDEGGTIVLPITAGENYCISARHDTDSYYTEAEKTISNMTFNVNVTSQTTHNRTVNITAKSNIFSEFMSGKLLFILPNGKNVAANYAGNGTWWAVHTFDDYADYQVNASYVGLDNVTVTNATISISKTPTEISVENTAVELGVGGSVGTGASLTPAGAGNLTYSVSNSSVVRVENGKIIAVGEGSAVVTVSFAGNADYEAAENKTISVTVSGRVHTEISVLNDTLVLGVNDEVATGAALIPAGAGNLTYSVSNSSVVRVVDGKIIAVGEGSAVITVSFVGDDRYAAAESKTISVTVGEKYGSKVIISPIADVVYPNNVTITYSIENRTDVSVSIEGVSDDKIIITNDTITVVGLDAGEYTITILNSENGTHFKSSDTKAFTVNKQPTSIGAAEVSTTYNINKDLVITLKDGTGKALSGVKVTVELNGAKTYTTDKNGQVKVSTKGLAPKTYTAKITFNGNTNYDKSAKNVKVTVKKATPKIKAKKKTFKKSKKVKKYKIKLKDNTGKAIKKAKVTLKVKGKKYTAKTNKKGKAVFKIKKLKKKGTYKAKVTYKGNKYYKKVSKKAKIKVIVTFKTVSKGSKDKSAVKEIQQALKDHGYYLSYKGHYLKVDGKFKSCTKRSVKEFQKDKGLKVTGKVDEKTAKKLRII